MIKKLNLILITIILLFLVVGAVSANEDNATDIIQKNLEDAPIPLSNSIEDETGNDDVLKTDAEDNNLSSIEDESAVSVENDDELSASKSKTNLKITTYTNFVKIGDTYYMYLTDTNGKGIANKDLTIKFEGKTYKQTTNAKGEFGVPIDISKSYVSMKISFNGDSQYNSLSQTLKVYIDKYLSIVIGNNKLLTNGFLRVYLKGPSTHIANKTIKIKVGNKEYTKKTSSEGFVVIKPMAKKGVCEVEVTYGNYKVSKKMNCIVGDVKNPLKDYIPTKNGIPDIDRMPATFVMADEDAQYTLTKDHYKQVLKRDSYCLYLYGKLSKYTFFKTKAEPNKYHILKREKWNVIERALNTILVKKNQYNYWPSSVSANLKGKSYTYSEVRDIQNTEYTCGPTSASMCGQALRNYFSEKYFQTEARVTSGVNIGDLKRVIDRNGFQSSYYYSVDSAVKQLAKGGVALIAFLPNHYVSIIDVSSDGKKILVSNSYGKYDVGGDSRVPTDWVSLSYFKSKFAGVGLVVKLKYNLKNSVKKQTNNFYKSMGVKWNRQNTNERIPDVGL